MRQHVLIGLLSAALASALDAQGVLDRLPRDPVLRFEFDGAPVWASSFAGTRLANALGERAVQDLLRPVREWTEAFATQRGRAIGYDVAGLFARYAAYSGRVHTTLEMATRGDGRTYVATMFVVATPDGVTQIDELADAAAAGVEAQEDSEYSDLTVGGRLFRVTPNPNEPTTLMTAPFVEAGHLVAVCATELERVLGRFLAPSEEPSPRADRLHGLLSVRLGVRQLVELVTTHDGRSPVDSELAEDRITAQLVEGIEDLALSIQTAGGDAVLELMVGFPSATPPIAAVFSSTERNALQRALGSVPRTSGAWIAGALDSAKLNDWLGSLIAAGESPDAWSTTGPRFMREAGVRLQQDLLAHVGSAMLCCGLPPGELEQLTPHPLTSSLPLHAVAVTLHDSASFQDSIERLLRQTGMHAARKQEEYQGATVHRLIVGGLFSVDYAITDRLLAIGIGEPGAILVRRILAEDRALATGQPQVELAGTTGLTPQPDAEPCLAAAFPLEWLLAWLEQAQDSARSAAARNRIALLTAWTDTILGALRRAGTENLYVTLHREPQRLVLRLRL